MTDRETDGALVLVTVGLAIGAGWAVNAALSRYGPGVLVGLTRQVVLISGLAITLLPMYYVFPDTDVTVKQVVPHDVTGL